MLNPVLILSIIGLVIIFAFLISLTIVSVIKNRISDELYQVIVGKIFVITFICGFIIFIIIRHMSI